MIKGIVMFSAGIAIGGLALWFHCKSKYEKIAAEEIEEIKAHYEKKQAKLNKMKEDVEPDDYEAVLEKNGYISVTESDNTVDESPYVISPTDFGEYEGYGQITLTFYADGVLADEHNEPVDIEMVGSKNLGYFGVYEEDSVYVRSDVHKCDYEILLSEDTHGDILKTMAPLPVLDADGNVVVYEEESETEE